MPTGAITENFDIAQLTLYAFWLFFFALVFYLRREDKREGYPLEVDRSTKKQGSFFPPIPGPKTFRLWHGGTYAVPPGREEAGTSDRLRAEPYAPWPGAPLQPTGNPMVDAVGPAAYADREDKPDTTFEGHDRIVPLRIATDHALVDRDPDPRGMEVVGGDGQVAGVVRDVWIDRSEPQPKFLEVEVAGAGRKVLVPTTMVRYDTWNRRVTVRSILAHQFADVPALKSPDQVTKLEEDKVMAYFAGGTLYAKPGRLWPAL